MPSKLNCVIYFMCYRILTVWVIQKLLYNNIFLRRLSVMVMTVLQIIFLSSEKTYVRPSRTTENRNVVGRQGQDKEISGVPAYFYIVLSFLFLQLMKPLQLFVDSVRTGASDIDHDIDHWLESV